MNKKVYPSGLRSVEIDTRVNESLLLSSRKDSKGILLTYIYDGVHYRNVDLGEITKEELQEALDFLNGDLEELHDNPDSYSTEE